MNFNINTVPGIVKAVILGAHEWFIIDTIGYRALPVGSPIEFVCNTPKAHFTSFSST
jgi:hypothetical protein